MYKMCYFCGAEMKLLDAEHEGKMNETPSGLDSSRDPAWFCQICGEKYEQESLRQDGLSSYATPLISPTISLKSSDSFVSSCSELLVDTNLQGMEVSNEGASDRGQQYPNASFQNPEKGIDRSGTITVEFLDDICSDRNTYSHDNSILKDEQIRGAGDDGIGGTEDGIDGYSRSSTSLKEGTELSHALDIETNPYIWLPPEPEDLEDDLVASVANNDDDDLCSDGLKWGQPSSLNRFDEEYSGSFRFKEERQKAMAEVMNGEFKNLVCRLLTLEGIPLSGEAGENWVDIVTSLSWEAALHIKPDAFEGKTMDPEGYVKVKCIATGFRSQSQLIKGLAFKKNAAHKHMQTKYKNPRLLLLQGMLGQSSSGLSSFDSMEQEKDNLKSVVEMIEMCHPNVVLVEKTVSRDVQESLLAKGITLVFDMKSHRLERIAVCTGSQILSSADSLMSVKLKQCESFYFEKFVEEHGIPKDGGKKPSKTLMFLEGCLRPLGCTVLLKGAHSDELKKVKSVVNCAVVVAYHLILETSFLVDQRAMFSTIHSGVMDGFLEDEKLPIVGSASSFLIDVPISDGLQETSAHEGISLNSNLDLEGNSTLFGFSPDISLYDSKIGESGLITHNMLDYSNDHQQEASHELVSPTIFPGQLLSSFSSSHKNVIGDSFPRVSTASGQSFSTYFGFKQREPESQNTTVLPVSTSSETPTYCEIDAKDKADELESPDVEQAESLSALYEVQLDSCKSDANNEEQMRCDNDVSTVLDAPSILFLASSLSVLKGTVCEQSHLCRIKYYRNFDVSLGWFLRDSLLNQRHRCSACGDPPEAHAYNYMHQNGKITVRVKQLSVESRLPGEAEGRLWMWAYCLKCESLSMNQRSTRRLVMSSAACGLSFGKFLELTFSIHSTNKLSNCGHSIQRDYLHFYGLGPMVAMFRCSSIDIYTACMPPPVLEFNSPIGQDWIKKEAESVLKKGLLLFSEVTNSLQRIVSGFHISHSNQPLNLTGSVKEFSDIEEMLKQERSDFESHIQKVIDKSEHLGQLGHKLLSLNGLIQELALESYVWDRRLHLLLSSDSGIANAGSTPKVMHEEQVQLQNDGINGGRIEETGNALHYDDEISDRTVATLTAPIMNKSSSSLDDSNVVSHISDLEAEMEIKIDETSTMENEKSVKEFQVQEQQYESLPLGSGHPKIAVNSSIDAEVNGRSTMGSFHADGSLLYESTACTAVGVLNDSVLGQDSSAALSHLTASLPMHDGSCQEEFIPISEPFDVDRTIPNTEELLTCIDPVTNLHLHGSTLGDVSSKSEFKGLEPSMSKSLITDLDDSEGWIWSPFSEIRKAYRKDLQRGHLQRYELINSYTPECLSSANQLITKEQHRLHITLGPEDTVVSAYESEPTSIIACALALLHERHSSAEDLVEKEARNEKGEDNKAIGNAHFLASDASMTSQYWSSIGSFDSEGIHSGESFSSDESYTSSFHGSNLVDSLMSLEDLHPEIRLEGGKFPGKGKYSVVCIYAKQFRTLRRRCCPCELDYIASLSRCVNWDAKGGKSGSLFVKTLDDRFIIKQIKKIEFDSFLKFAQDYFKYTNQSLNSGNQSCLAKILGIYQVTIRQAKSGKDLKYDLMVMENLMFGRNITRLYDLKGAQHARYTAGADGAGKVFLDQNFVEDMNRSPVYVSGKTKHFLQRAIWNDTSFLTSINVMDYSLLVGVDMERCELVCGIIDYLRQYTWDKHLETWVKASLVVPKNVSPTVVSPKEYKKRFRKFMSMYFFSLPG